MGFPPAGDPNRQLPVEWNSIENGLPAKRRTKRKMPVYFFAFGISEARMSPLLLMTLPLRLCVFRVWGLYQPNNDPAGSVIVSR